VILFEDKKDDLLSELFRRAYPETISEKFVYAEGNGNLPISFVRRRCVIYNGENPNNIKSSYLQCERQIRAFYIIR
jgi:hypothetical protein